jgi:hypothetical protein
MGLGSGILKKTYSGSRIRVQGSKGTGSRIRIRNKDYKKFYVKKYGSGSGLRSELAGPGC